MTTTKIHRRYPDRKWDYKAISTIFNDGGTKRNVIYHTLTSDGKKTEGVEILTGSNYIVGSKDKSNARTYKLADCPSKYTELVGKLKKVHQSSSWSSANYVNEN